MRKQIVPQLLLCLGVVVLSLHMWLVPRVYTEDDGTRDSGLDESTGVSSPSIPVAMLSSRSGQPDGRLRISTWSGNGRIQSVTGEAEIHGPDGTTGFGMAFEGWRRDGDFNAVFALSLADVDFDGIKEILIARQDSPEPDWEKPDSWYSYASKFVIQKNSPKGYQPIAHSELPWHGQVIAAYVGRQLTTAVKSADPLRFFLCFGTLPVSVLGMFFCAVLLVYLILRGKPTAGVLSWLWFCLCLLGMAGLIMADKLSYAAIITLSLFTCAGLLSSIQEPRVSGCPSKSEIDSGSIVTGES